MGDLSDLDELILKVRDTETKRLLREAVNAYRGGAYRASIVSTWIAVAYDIICKIKELSGRGEAAAQAFVVELEKAVTSKNLKKLQEIENSLLEVSQNDFSFLLPHEATDLQRIFDDRNFCAHPAFVADDTVFSPSPELVRAHIIHAVKHLLSHPPIQGKSAMVRLHRDLLGTTFPTEPSKIQLVMQEDYVRHTKDSVILSILKGLLITPLKNERLKFKGKERAIANAFAAIGKIRPDLFEPEMPSFVKKTADETTEPSFINLIRFVGAEPRCWEWIGNTNRIRMLELLARMPLGDLMASGCFDALCIDEIAKALVPRVGGLTEEERYNVISENPAPQFVSEAIRLYKESGSFRTAEIRGEKIILPHSQYFTKDDLSAMLQAAIDNNWNQILGAAGTSAILIKLFDARLDLKTDTKNAWAALYNIIVKKGLSENYDYPELIEKLVIADVIEPPPAVPDTEEPDV